jgi:hypothetical protein
MTVQVIPNVGTNDTCENYQLTPITFAATILSSRQTNATDDVSGQLVSLSLNRCDFRDCAGNIAG